MNAMILNSYGLDSTFELAQVPSPEVEEVQVLVKIAVVSSTGHCNTFESYDDTKGTSNKKAKEIYDSSRPQDYLAGVARW